MQDLEKAGWLLIGGGKGSHRKFAHPKSTRKVILSGASCSDARPYQDKLVKAAMREARKMKTDYLKFVQWSAADRLFVGYCPDLFIGGVCHGRDEQKVYRELARLVAKGIAESEQTARPLPAKRALVTVPVAV